MAVRRVLVLIQVGVASLHRKTSTRTQIKAKHEQQNLKLLNAELNNIKKLLSELFQINTKY